MRCSGTSWLEVFLGAIGMTEPKEKGDIPTRANIKSKEQDDDVTRANLPQKLEVAVRELSEGRVCSRDACPKFWSTAASSRRAPRDRLPLAETSS